MPVPVTNERAIANRRLLRDDVYERLLAAIVDGVLEPGERLRDEELATWLGVSRTPIREAITRLVDLGLIEMEPNRYTRVAVVDVKRYLDAQRVLSAMYVLAVELGGPGLTETDWAALDALVEDGLGSISAPGDLHSLLTIWEFIAVFANRADNAVLTRTIDEIGPEVRRVGRYTWEFVDSEAARTEYLKIFEALRSRDLERIAEALLTGSRAVAQQMAEAAHEAWRQDPTSPEFPH